MELLSLLPDNFVQMAMVILGIVAFFATWTGYNITKTKKIDAILPAFVGISFILLIVGLVANTGGQWGNVLFIITLVLVVFFAIGVGCKAARMRRNGQVIIK